MRWSLLAGLPDDERRHVLSRARRRRYGRREVIFHEGDAGDAVHLVDKGHVAVTVTTPMGDAALLRVVRPGEFFGELVLLSAGPRSATASALDGAETLSLHRDDFDELRRTSAPAQEALATALANEVRRLATALSEALYLSAEQRLWRRLADMATIFDGVIPLTQDELGQLAGTTRQTANRLLREAEAAGAIELGRGRCAVVDATWVAHKAKA